MADNTDGRLWTLVELVRSVADVGGPAEIAKAVDDRAYRRGVKDGKRAQKSADLPVLLAVSGIAVLIGQVPHLLLWLHRRSEEKKAQEKKDRAKIEKIRAELETRLHAEGKIGPRT